ncbi:MAG: cobalt ECF transporter T component CbiQ [Drouetiella hepatica Uher 2000/2452]|jgi:cobalt/nickel transport system permease protein|uniref:Cobalt ECF transporter T component CbiQ n=1 Tax=Drouetiella hepatica Uher 2000/2452 TaxID=904376 RepID=A0A951URF4_9CYAN|nr:cobalt ECF transporter T component CbiQ [Drouetiella hepatica Uher 2000/2452]
MSSLQIDTLAYSSRLRQLPPEHKLLFAIALLLITYAADAPVQLLVAVWLSIWTVVYAGIPTSVYFRLLSITTAFWLTSLPALMVNEIDLSVLPSVQTDVFQGFTWENYYIYLSHRGIQQAGELGARAIASTSCIYFVILTVPFTEILNVLRRIGCPELLVELMMLMYRFIFVLLQTANQIWTAQQSRGGYRTRKLWLKSLGLLIGQLLRRTLENYRQVSLTLTSRGFTGNFRVCHSRQYRSSRRYSFEALLGCAILLILTGWNYAIRI